MTLGIYTVLSAFFIISLYFIFMNMNNKSTSKVKERPKIKPIQLFNKNRGLSENEIQKKFNIKT